MGDSSDDATLLCSVPPRTTRRVGRTAEPFRGDDHVIEKRHLEEVSHLGQAPRDLLVLARRRWVPGWVVVRHDHEPGTVAESHTEDPSRVHESLPSGADREHLLVKQSVLRVEAEKNHALVVERDQARRKQLVHFPWFVQHRPLLGSAGCPPKEFQGGENALHLAGQESRGEEFVGAREDQANKRAEIPEHLVGALLAPSAGQSAEKFLFGKTRYSKGWARMTRDVTHGDHPSVRGSLSRYEKSGKERRVPERVPTPCPGVS